MKYARNTFLGLVFLVLVYGSCYRLFYREEMLTSFRAKGISALNLSGPGGAWRKFYAPATEIDLRLTWDRPAKQRLVGHWLSEKPGDFVILAKDGHCRFQLGEFASSADFKFLRGPQFYAGKFTHQGNPHLFHILFDPPGRANAFIQSRDSTIRHEFPHLTRAEAPD